MLPKFPFLLFKLSAFSILLLSCYPPRTPIQKLARKYQSGKLTEDTSVVYQLPYTEGTKSTMFQGYYSRFTHKHRAAVDFKMKPGSEIRAARSGVVLRTKEDSDVGGWNKKYRGDANFIIIEHDDSTRAAYRHLQFEGALIETGDTVKTGELIGYSGKTGYRALPHLHFMVSAFINNQWTQIPTRFATRKKDRYLKSWVKYESINKEPFTLQFTQQ